MGTFALGIDRWCDKAEDTVETVVRRVTLAMFTEIVLRSPVDTGRFRGNWQVDTRDSRTPTDVSGQVTITKMTGKVSRSEVGGVVSFINVMPYGPRLEAGYSGQAPQGMVRVTALNFGAVVEEEAAKT